MGWTDDVGCLSEMAAPQSRLRCRMLFLRARYDSDSMMPAYSSSKMAGRCRAGQCCPGPYTHSTPRHSGSHTPDLRGGLHATLVSLRACDHPAIIG